MNSAQLITHAITELEQAEQVLADHQTVANGCCACGRGLPCSEAATWIAYRNYWNARLAWMAEQQVKAPT